MRTEPLPAPTRDLDSPDEIAEMVRRFYADVAQDELLGPLFNDVAQVDWSEHLPKLTLFWCRALLGIEGYVGNPFRAHVEVHEKSPFSPAHFQRWLDLFHSTLEDGWVGPRVDRALALARNVARVHRQQILGPDETFVEGAVAPPAAPTAAADTQSGVGPMAVTLGARAQTSASNPS